MIVRKGISIVITVIILFVSIFVCGSRYSSPDAYGKSIQYLDSKKNTVLELAGATTAASIGISALPGDAATPIANKLADLSTWFMLIVCALFLEKYLVTIAGFATFYILIPAACILYLLYILINAERFRKTASKILTFALAIFLLVPVSVYVSNMIESTYQASIDDTLAAAQQTLDEINAEEPDTAVVEEPAADTGEKTTEKFYTRILNKVENAASNVKDAADNVKESINAMPEKLETMMNNFIEAVAVLLVTSCLIPVLVLLAFIWFFKLLIGLDTPLALPSMDAPRRLLGGKSENSD